MGLFSRLFGPPTVVKRREGSPPRTDEECQKCKAQHEKAIKRLNTTIGYRDRKIKRLREMRDTEMEFWRRTGQYHSDRSLELEVEIETLRDKLSEYQQHGGKESNDEPREIALEAAMSLRRIGEDHPGYEGVWQIIGALERWADDYGIHLAGADASGEG
jgi:hypothetical protein